MEKVAIAVSGGIDSYICYRWAKSLQLNVIPYFIDYGQPYINKEKPIVEKLIPKAIHIKADLVEEKLNNVPTIEKQEIYGRNILMAFYGALLGDKIWLAVLETEMSPHAVTDKRPEFLYQLSALFSHTFKSLREDTCVESPVRNMTKSDIVKMALGFGVTKEEILQTSSCYHSDYHTCGKCSTCFKRWVAMINNNIEEKTQWHPYHENEYSQKIVEVMRNEVLTNNYSGRFTQKRIKETDSALLKLGVKGIL